MLQALYATLRRELLANAAVNTAVGGRVYRRVMPRGGSLPCVLVTFAGGGPDNETPNDGWTAEFNVIAVSEDGAEAAEIASAIHDALHERAFAFEGGLAALFTVIDCRTTASIEYDEITDKTVYQYAGGLFRLRVSEIH
jgi:hypothetical protein